MPSRYAIFRITSHQNSPLSRSKGMPKSSSVSTPASLHRRNQLSLIPPYPSAISQWLMPYRFARSAARNPASGGWYLR